MLEADGVSPHTAHTTNPVPLIVTASDVEARDGGELAGLAPTVLHFLGIEAPVEMTGEALVNRT
jgi:2,3-bisphosphoglycerate-independent phosphoglycerate mutase